MKALAILLIFVQSARAEIVGPTEPIPVGRPVILDASSIEAGCFIWDCLTDAKQYRTFDAGKVLCFWAPQPGNYRFVLFVANQNGEKIEGEKHVFLVQVSGAVPNPNPKPPNPGPDKPNFPDSRFGLSLAVYNAAASVPDAAADAGKLADAFFGVSARIAAGTLTGQKNVMAATKAANVAALGDRVEAWLPVLGELLPKELQRLDKAGNLKTDRDIRDAWMELAVGLKAVK